MRCQPRCLKSVCEHSHMVCFMVCAVLLVHLASSPVPAATQNPAGLKVAFTFWKAYVWVIEHFGWVFGLDNGYLFFKYSVLLAPPGLLNYGVKATDTVFSGVPVRVYEPDTLLPQDNRGIVFYHGGGWIVGNLDMFDTTCRRISSETNSVVVSVDYRLGPEFFFPAPLDDCVAATSYFIDHAAAYKVDPNRVAVSGDSAGGNLAASVALKLRDLHHDPQPAAQILLYPALQAVDFHTPSYQQNPTDPILTRENMAGFWLMYAQGHTANRDALTKNNHTSADMKAKLRSTYLNYDNIPTNMRKDDTFKEPSVDFGNGALWEQLKGTLTNPYFSPLMAESLDGLPPSFVMSMNHDVLRDDSYFYAHRLRSAGNNVTYMNYLPGYHGIVSYPLPFTDTDKAFDIIYKYIQDNL